MIKSIKKCSSVTLTIPNCAHKLYKFQKCLNTKTVFWVKLKNPKHANKLKLSEICQNDKGKFGFSYVSARLSFACFYTAVDEKTKNKIIEHGT